jgi:SAM-dependent methyltransferase
MSEHDTYQLTDSGPENYERHQVPSVFGPLAERFLTIVSLQAGERVLDVACGTGIVARLATQQVGATGHVFPCENESYDVVLCQQGLQFVSDKPQALREMHRVLVPGGRLAICSWSAIEHNPWNREISVALARHVSEEAAARPRAPFALGDETLLRTLISDAGFRCIDIQTHTLSRQMDSPEEAIPGYLASTPNAQLIAELPSDVRTALFGEISEALHKYQNQDGMLVPSETYIALANK